MKVNSVKLNSLKRRTISFGELKNIPDPQYYGDWTALKTFDWNNVEIAKKINAMSNIFNEDFAKMSDAMGINLDRVERIRQFKGNRIFLEDDRGRNIYFIKNIGNGYIDVIEYSPISGRPIREDSYSITLKVTRL